MKLTHIMSFTVPAIPPSYTASFKINYGLRRTYLSQEAKRFKDLVKISLPNKKFPQDTKFYMHNEYHSDWYYGNGNIKKKDVQNLNRLLIDAVFKGKGIDDSWVFAVTDEKIQASKDKTVVSIYSIDSPEYQNNH